jgi:hypothetical protein
VANTQQKGIDMARPPGFAPPEVRLIGARSSPRAEVEAFEQKMKTQFDAEPVLRCGSSGSRWQNNFVAELGITGEEISFLLYYA